MYCGLSWKIDTKMFISRCSIHRNLFMLKYMIENAHAGVAETGQRR